MLYYDGINISEGLYPTKSNCFFNHGFKFQDSVGNGCHNLMISCFSISNIATITVKNVDYHCIIHNISESEGINLLENSVLKIMGIYKKILS